jgi:uncharacterized protein
VSGEDLRSKAALATTGPEAVGARAEPGGPAAPDNAWSDGSPVPSPCINVCTMLAQPPLCGGCLRSLDEIASWSQMSNPQRQAVWRRIELRRAALPAANLPP